MGAADAGEVHYQQQITPKIVFENVIAALTLAERLLRSTENVEEFNNLLKTSNRSRENDAFSWQAEYYARAKNAIGEQGDGLGKDVVKRFLPRHAIPDDETLQNAVDSHYAERRQAAAEARAAAYEAERQAN
jgi:hypothetical protein